MKLLHPRSLVAGIFDDAAVLIRRTSAPDSPTLSQDQALLDPFGALNIPIIADVEFGHVRPRLSIVNGALHRLAFNLDERYLEQSLV